MANIKELAKINAFSRSFSKGGKRNNTDKVDDLQKSLKDVTNRLSASEENLLELSSKYDDKDQELVEVRYIPKCLPFVGTSFMLLACTQK